ncbi:MAG TPA: nucleoside-diphosphate kinase [Bdellovibrionales bacterium]|nr:nucleoside-diphosphate kinase [Pseudobdellovibrionaceae bacterium]HAG91371.1 nucleoside-diphosphate kinase [Bdellovibrionales bacterium]|tara:strand:+ start:5459 stop:5884 length:426 start_codon:yes stop_codon:yes gene_type:complete
MAMETTFSIIKPNAVKKNVIGAIIEKFEENGLKVAAAKLAVIPRAQCEEFYAEHKERPFFGELVDFMTSGPVMLMALHGENAITRNREIMGATNPAEAAEGTLRKLYGDSMGENAVHGSDSPASAERELKIFFTSSEMVNK